MNRFWGGLRQLDYTALIRILFFVLLSYLFVFSVIMPRYSQFNNTMLLDSGIAGLLLCGLVWAFRQPRTERIASLLGRRVVIIPLFAGLIIIQAVIAFSLAINPLNSGWDPLTLYQSALSLIDPSHWPSVGLGYFQAYPNNLGLLGLIAGWLSLTGHLGFHDQVSATIILNLAFMNTTLVMLYLCIKRLLGSGAAIFGLLLGFVFITLSLWSRTLYSDTVGMVFPITVFYLLLRLRAARAGWRQIALATAIGVISGLGYSIKPTTIFVSLAAIIVYVLSLLPAMPALKRPRLKMMAIIAACFLVGLGATATIIKQAMISRTHLTVNSMPITNFMLMGLTDICTPQECRYGAWNMPDALEQGTFTDMRTYRSYTIGEIKHRLKAYGAGGYLQFASQKGAWIIGDGTFYAYHEGTDRQAPLVHNSRLNRYVQSWMHIDGRHYVLFENIIQVFWIMMLLAILLPFALKRYGPARFEINTVYISLLGLLAFLLLFEARSRYLYLYIPIFIIAASYGFRALVTRRESAVTRRSAASRVAGSTKTGRGKG